MKNIIVKICGLTCRADALAALNAGADYLGAVLVAKSPRQVTPEQFREIFAGMEEQSVAVVADMEFDCLQKLIATLRPAAIQLHGHESADYAAALSGTRVWKAWHLRSEADVAAAADFPADMLLADAATGGSGQCCDWKLAAQLARHRQILIAGGINPDNIVSALAATGGAGADISSGVEYAAGRKSIEAINRIMNIKSLFKGEKR